MSATASVVAVTETTTKAERHYLHDLTTPIDTPGLVLNSVTLAIRTVPNMRCRYPWGLHKRLLRNIGRHIFSAGID